MDHGRCALVTTYDPVLLLDGSQELDQAERLRPGQRSGWRLGVPGPVRVAGGNSTRQLFGLLEPQRDDTASRKPDNGKTDKPKPRDSKWVLVVNLNPGAVAGGSGAQYFIGKFDGKTIHRRRTSFDPSTPPPGTVFQNFESSTTFAGLGWTATGDFVGKGPALGTCQVKAGYPAFLANSW